MGDQRISTLRKNIHTAKPSMRLTLISLTALLLAGLSPLATADSLPVRNEASTSRGFLLPALGSPFGDYGLRLQLDLSNEFVLSSSGSESLLVDAETLALRMRTVRPVSGDWEIGADLVYRLQGGGFMDDLIENWHDFFGLPNAGRERAPQDEYHYRYRRDGQTVVDLRGSSHGFGDASLWLGHALNPQWTWRTALKLPLGNEADLNGNGELGIASWMDGHWHQQAWSGFASAGVSYNPRGGALSALKQEWIGIAGAGLNWQWLRWLQLRSQLYFHTPLYDQTRIDALEKPGLQLTLGTRITLGERSLDIAFQEDLITSSSADFSLHFSLH